MVTVKNEIAPPIPSGYPAYRNKMMAIFALFVVMYIFVEAMGPAIIDFFDLPPSADEFCKGGSPCYRSDLLSFEVVSGVALMWCGFVGLFAWHFQQVQKSVPQTPEGRVFGYIKEAHILTAVGATFQVFDFFISLLIEEQRQPLFLAHHVAAALVSWYGLNNQYFHYYAVFYLGCSEISTIPLVFVDLAKFFPPLPGTPYDTFVGVVCQPLFAITFVYYRVILWWVVGFQMYGDIRHVIKTGIAEKLRPGRNHVLYAMGSVSFLLGLLQLFWLSIIVKEAVKVLGGTSDS